MTPDDIWTHCKRLHYSAAVAQYWMLHTTDEAERHGPSDVVHHIRSRGAGGDDDPANLLALSVEAHNLYHTGGRSVFCRKYPHLKSKVDAALERSRV